MFGCLSWRRTLASRRKRPTVAAEWTAAKPDKADKWVFAFAPFVVVISTLLIFVFVPVGPDLVTGVTILVGVVMTYIYKDESPEWLRTHYEQQIRLFWIGLLYCVIAGILTAILIPPPRVTAPASQRRSVSA